MKMYNFTHFPFTGRPCHTGGGVKFCVFFNIEFDFSSTGRFGSKPIKSGFQIRNQHKILHIFHINLIRKENKNFRFSLRPSPEKGRHRYAQVYP